MAEQTTSLATQSARPCPNKRCDEVWNPRYVKQCPKCGALAEPTERSLAPAAGLKMSGVVDRIEAANFGQSPPAQTVVVTDLHLSWSSVLEISFKFMVVFAIFQAVFLVIALLVWN